MKNALLAGIALLILISSCKENEPTPQPQPINNYTPLAIGNYWIYSTFSTDTLGNETELGKIDSVVIDRDTIINGNIYSVLMGTDYPTIQDWGIVEIVRDSGSYLVNSEGVILFSDDNFDDVLAEKIEIHNSDTLYTLTYKMEETNNTIEVPAGSFDNPLNYMGTVITYEPAPGVDNPRYKNNYYSENTGKIFENYFFLSSPNSFEKRLVRYNVQ